jgi:hypothetical protein
MVPGEWQLVPLPPRALSLAMIRRLNKSLHIPAEVLIRPVRKRKRRA